MQSMRCKTTYSQHVCKACYQKRHFLTLFAKCAMQEYIFSVYSWQSLRCKIAVLAMPVRSVLQGYIFLVHDLRKKTTNLEGRHRKMFASPHLSVLLWFIDSMQWWALYQNLGGYVTRYCGSSACQVRYAVPWWFSWPLPGTLRGNAVQIPGFKTST